MTIPSRVPVAAEQVGLVMVHGIGEQGRFEHLDGHIRGIINGLRRTGAPVTVEIMSSPVAAFQAMQDSWVGPLRLLVREPGRAVDCGKSTIAATAERSADPRHPGNSR